MNARMVGTLSVAVLALATAAGCGGSSSDEADDDSAGKGGSSGSGGSSGTGGTGGIETPAASGLSISLSPTGADQGSRSCPAGATGAFTYAIGQPAPNKTIANGVDGVSVSCTVTASGTVDGTVDGPDTYSKQAIAFNALSMVTDKTKPTPATVSFYTAETHTLQVLDGMPDCTLDPIVTLKTGAILADFSCPLLGAVDDPSIGCKAVGTLAFEYCHD